MSGSPFPRRRLRRRSLRMWVLIAAFILVPIVEIYVIIQVGQAIGPWWTILLLIAGQMPARELADGALILVGGTLMLSPGFVTDAMGILLILPFTRPIARRLLTRVVGRRLLDARRPGPGPQGPVIPGEVVDDDR